MSDPIKAWQCIGCGRIEAPQNCVGICQDRRVEFVYASEHADTESDLVATQGERDALHSLVRRLAWSRPHAGDWERSYRALQTQARVLLTKLDANRATWKSNAIA